MDNLTSEILILMVFCIVWTLIATPTLAREMHRLQWVYNWLAVLVVAPTIFYLGWILLKRLGA